MAKAHQHAWRESGWSLDGPLVLWMTCLKCPTMEHFQPRKRLRTPPKGMTQERFEAYKALAEDDELLQAFRERLVTANDRQMGDAWQRGILPPLPTPEDLEAYRARTAQRLAKRVPDEPSPACRIHGPENWRVVMSSFEAHGVSFPAYSVCNICHPATLAA